MSVRVSIGQLVMRGFEPAQAKAVATALELELKRVMATQEGGQARQMSVLRVGLLPLAAGQAGGRRLGAGLAAAIGRAAGGGKLRP